MHLPLPSTEMATRSGEVSVAIEGLQDALRQRKATLAEIAHQAGARRGFTVIQPYFEALAANGYGDQAHRASVRARLLSHQHGPQFSRSPVRSLATLR